MKRLFFLLSAMLCTWQLYAQRYETVPFGDFESWAVRYVKESAVIGGETKKLYMLAPKDTIRGNKVYDYKNTIWTGSNAYAVVMGITKVSNSVVPEKGPSGLCARLETAYASVKAIGIINIKVVAGGALFWGRTLEPISGINNSYASMDWGVPFTKRPKAVVLDYKAVVPNTGKLAKGSSFVDGYDPEEIMLILQNRTEDAQGNIHAKRVGTAFYHIDKSTGAWMKNFRIPVMYGDASRQPGYKDYMGLKTGDATLYAVNSKGESKPVIEDGWASPDAPVTHAVMSICSSSQVGFTAAIGNILWVDNIRLEYQDL